MDSTIKEKVFYQDVQVTVTQARFIAENKTYAMSNISSVSAFRIKRSRKLEILLIAVGIMLVLSEAARPVGVLAVLLGILLLFFLKDSYSVRINSNSGETNGLISKDREYIEKIVNAVNEAIIHRG